MQTLKLELLRQFLEMFRMLEHQCWKISGIPPCQMWHWRTLLTASCRPAPPWRTFHSHPQSQSVFSSMALLGLVDHCVDQHPHGQPGQPSGFHQCCNHFVSELGSLKQCTKATNCFLGAQYHIFQNFLLISCFQTDRQVRRDGPNLGQEGAHTVFTFWVIQRKR